MAQEIKLLLGIIFATLLILGGAVFLLSKSPQDLEKEKQNALVRGSQTSSATSSAQVSLIEFADFQCPACAAAHSIIRSIKEEYKDRITFSYRHFPLPQHKNALIGAEAAEAAGEQGKFWEMHDILFIKQEEWSESSSALDLYKGYAKEIGLDVTKFTESIQSGKHREKINQDKKDGETLGVNSTPTFFIDEARIIGVPSLNDLKEVIQKRLSQKS